MKHSPFIGYTMIICRNIYKSFGSSNIINNFSADFLKGTNLLSGPNGSGKSTLLMAISGIESINSGKIEILNNSKSYREIFSISTDSISEPEYFTLHEIFSLQRKFNKTDDKLFEELIFELNLSKFLNCSLSNISTGTRKNFQSQMLW